VRALSGRLRVHSDSDSLVRVLTTPTPPNRRKPGRLSHRVSDRHAQMGQLREVLAGRDVDLVAIAGHSASTPVAHRAADLLCRYGTIRLAASGLSELTLSADDLADHLGAEVAISDRLARACAKRLAELDIYHEDQGDGGPDLDWRSGGFEIDGFGVSATQRRIVRLERLVKWARRRGDVAVVECAEIELMALLSGIGVERQMTVPNYRMNTAGYAADIGQGKYSRV
jgi:hypothetical protein